MSLSTVGNSPNALGRIERVSVGESEYSGSSPFPRIVPPVRASVCRIAFRLFWSKHVCDAIRAPTVSANVGPC